MDKNERNKRGNKNQGSCFCIICAQLQRFQPKNIGYSGFEKANVNYRIKTCSYLDFKSRKEPDNRNKIDGAKKEIQK